MAMLGRKQPAPSPPGGSPPSRTRAATGGRGGGGGGGSTTTTNTRVGRLRGNIRDIIAELRKVNWPTREETRNLTIVVIGISATIGAFLGAFDLLLSWLYGLIK